MRKEKFFLKTLDQSAELMYHVIYNYHDDVKAFDKLTVEQCFDYVKNLKYIPDPKDFEAISRPKYSLSKYAAFRDCDDKTIILACMLLRRGIKFKLAFVSDSPKKDIHHICLYLPEVRFFLDATYPSNEFGYTPKFYKKVLY